MSTTNSDLDRIDKLAHEFSSKAMEHADSVAVFCTVREGGEDVTKTYNHITGNWYAVFGQVDEWIGVSRHRSNVLAIKRDEEEEE